MPRRRGGGPGSWFVRLAVALVVAMTMACGGGDSGDAGGSGGDSVEALCQRACPYLQMCDPEGFAEDYGDQATCHSECKLELEYYLELDGQACYDLNQVLLDCEIDGGYCSFDEPGWDEACGAAQAALNETCGL